MRLRGGDTSYVTRGDPFTIRHKIKYYHLLYFITNKNDNNLSIKIYCYHSQSHILEKTFKKMINEVY